jgi:hypothetical protein
MADLKTKNSKTVNAKMPRHRYGETAPIGEDEVMPIGDTDIWGNGINNNYVQPAIGVQGFRLNAAARLLSVEKKHGH